ncbi:MAG: chemotaxis protein CheW [Desulfovibrionaceae bacterium]
MSSFVYRDVRVPEDLRGIIHYMGSVERYREELSNLGSQWDLLTILGQMSGTGTDMTGTREGFQNLTSELLGQLGLETLKKTAQDIGAKAQVAVDIVIRNLFERTADIGFLATDDDIREFLRSFGELDADEDVSFLADALDSIVDRFHEYVAKYSVYFDIVLMDTSGKIAARLDRTRAEARSFDPLISEALTTRRDYVEIFRETDLLPGEGDSLVYAYRVTESNDAGSKPLGVLALCFRFQNEMEGVFKKLRSEGDWAVLTLLDKSGRVIASSDENQVHIGARIELALGADYRVVRFAGREYLAKTCETNGYEGFFGLGWLGHAMLPLEHAFEQNGGRDLGLRVEDRVLSAVMNDPRLFSEALRSIPVQADRIQAELERTVWNGNVRESDAQSKVLLWNISDAGARTKSVFEKSIGNLHETVVSALLADVEFQAALAVDIMDRNLYERANDCRWWALTSAFRRILAQPEISSSDLEKISDILAYINGLYTVYTTLFLYDARGRILAVSKKNDQGLVGVSLSDSWVAQTLSVHDSQQYTVSPFEATELYGGRHTYVYSASITDIVDHKKVLGGIGIVFDSEPQFAAMLEDSMPGGEGCFGVFVERSGAIISTTAKSLRVGDHMDIDSEFLSLPNGEKTSRIIVFEGQYYAVGGGASSGYREYKVNDDYQNDVIGLVFAPLAEVREQQARQVRRRDASMQVGRARTGGSDCVEIATFYIGPKWLGIEASQVVEAVRYEKVTEIPGAPKIVRGKTVYRNEVIPIIELYSEMRLPYPQDESQLQVILVKYAGTGDTERIVGICVDALGEIPEICYSRVDTSHTVLDGKGYTESIIKPEPGAEKSELLVVLSPEGLMRHLCGRACAETKVA